MYNQKQFVDRHAKRAEQAGAGGSFTLQQWEDLKAHYNFLCVRCLTPERKARLTVDHVKPVSRGGGSFIENIQPLCKACNSSKNDTFQDYRPSFWKKVWSKIVMASLLPPDDDPICPGDAFVIINDREYKLAWLVKHFECVWTCGFSAGYQMPYQLVLGSVTVPFHHGSYTVFVTPFSME